MVDQFEELFRYRNLATLASPDAPTLAIEEATAFVNLLLEVCAHPQLPIYVVLTMRSDFQQEKIARLIQILDAVKADQPAPAKKSGESTTSSP